MEFLVSLWLPILIGTIVLFICSFVAWAMLPHHIGDHQKVPCEDELMEFIRSKNIPSGNYLVPYFATGAEQRSPEYQKTYTDGPRGLLDVYEMPNMGVNMFKTILYFFVTVLTIAYITNVACPPGTQWTKVFRVSGTIAILTYATSCVLHRVWFTKRVWTEILDGVVYGLVLGLIFASLWPGA